MWREDPAQDPNLAFKPSTSTPARAASAGPGSAAGYEAVGRVEYAAEQWQRSPARKRGSASAAWLSLHQRWQHAGWLIRTIVIAVGILLVFNVLSSGAFYGFRGPHERELPREVREDIRDIYILAGGPRNSAGLRALDEQHALIPKVIHQTYKSSNVPEAVLPYMQSWRDKNPDWEVRFYDDAACLNFIRDEFPEYLTAYRALPKDVERSDFFRYMVVLRLGGVYADVDTECTRPLDQLLQPHDAMLVSWENEFATAEEASKRQYVRKRQVLQWVFAAMPGHPVLREMCDHIAHHATMHFTRQASLDTLERTGPGVWTDIILRHALAHPPARRQVDPWVVRILPMVFFGAHPAATDEVDPEDPNVAVLHHFIGSWKDRGWKILHPSALKRLAILAWQYLWPKTGLAAVHDDGLRHMYPVSITWQPPFSMLVDLKGHGDLQAGDDVSALLTKYGTWQPSLQHTRGPSVMEALVGSLGGKGGDTRVLLDVGAGIGLFSLAAAARGHHAIAFELSQTSLNSFQQSIAFNGFERQIQLHKAALGHHTQQICLSPIVVPDLDSSLPLAHGYGQPALHDVTTSCMKRGQRHVGSAFIDSDVEIGAVHISAPGWEGWIVQGLLDVLKRQVPPGAILLELHPDALDSNGYQGGAVALLQELYNLGYTDISHSGHVCDERWQNITRSIKLQTAVGLPPPETLQQPTWCQLQPLRFANVAQRVPRGKAENILLTRKPPGSLLADEQSLPVTVPEKVYHGHIILTSGEQIEVSAGSAVVEWMHQSGMLDRQVGRDDGVLQKFARRHFLNRPASGPASSEEQAQGGEGQFHVRRR